MTLSLAIGGFCLAFLLALLLNWLALKPWRRSIGKHWTERARLLYPAQKSAGLNNLLVPVNIGILSYILWPEVDFLQVVLASFLGSLVASYFMSREVVPDLEFKSWIRLIIAGLFLFLIRWVVLIFSIFQMPDNFGFLTWICAGGILIFLLAFNFGLGICLLRLLRLLRPASEHLKSLVTEVSQKMGVPVRSSWIFSTHINNAVAFPLTRQLIFTDKLLSTLSDDETKAVCAHELGHLNEPRKVKLMRLLVSLAFFPLIFARPLGSLGENGSSAYGGGL